jgi:GNAT superfamily N-acetyltransferase
VKIASKASTTSASTTTVMICARLVTYAPEVAIGFVRPARPDDVGEIARIQLATWRQAYERLMPRHVLAQISEDFLSQRWSEAVTSPPDPRHRVLVAIEQSQQDYVVGFLASEPSDGVASIIELLVEPRWGRRGHGSRLLAATVDLWREDGFTSAGMWAFEQDPAMTKFLTSAGWEPDGQTRSLDMDDMLVPQIHWHVSLSSEEVPETDDQTRPLDH